MRRSLQHAYDVVGERLYSGAWATEARVRRLRDRRVSVDGLEVAYYDGGPRDAPVVVLLHGFSANRSVWIRFAGHLTGRYRVLVPDLAGHGHTPFAVGTDYSPPAHAQRLRRFLDTLEVERAHVLGNSMGGFVAATLTLADPGRVQTLGLSDAVGVAEPTPGDAAVRIAAGDNPFLLDDVAGFPSFFAMTMARPPFAPAVVRAAIARDYVRRRDELDEMFGQFYRRHQLDGELARIHVPTLVVWGERDRLVHVSAARTWADGLPDARVVVYQGIGHMPMLEIPRRSARDYLSFLTEAAGRPATELPATG